MIGLLGSYFTHTQTREILSYVLFQKCKSYKLKQHPGTSGKDLYIFIRLRRS